MNSKKVTPDTKTNIPTMISLRHDESLQQTTLTQLYNPNNDEESSVEEPMRPIKRGKKSHTSPTLGRTTVRSSEKFDGQLFEVGELVMTTAGDINHPAVDHGHISSSYIIVGCVTGWRNRKWALGNTTDFDHVIVNWMNVEVGGNRYQDFKDGNPCYDDDCRLFNIFVNFDFVHTGKLHSLADTAVAKVKKVNDFLKVVIFENFCHGSKRGWMKILPTE